MSTEVATYQNSLDSDWRYAQAVTTAPERGAQSLLPQAYRGNPANVLIAIGLGNAIGISPAQALYEIYVVNGRPSPSANLMAALVRRAGHKLRINGDAKSCTATLIRSDDADEPFTATWTIEQARGAGLAGKDTWKSYPAAMLRARAIAEVVRMGASEAVIGMDYSAEEMRDVEQSTAPVVVKANGTDALRAAVIPAPAEDVQDAEVVPEDAPEPMTDKTRKHMFALFGELNIGEHDQRAGIAHIIGRPVESRGDLTETEAQQVLTRLKVKKAEQDAGAEPVEPDLFVGERA